jgi:hypothetical protein
VWGEGKSGDESADADDSDSDSDSDSGRLIDFVVAKTNDREENVVARAGFIVCLSFGPLL